MSLDFLRNCCGEWGPLIGLVSILWSFVLTFFVWQTYRYNRQLFGDTKENDLKKILHEHINRVGVVQTRINDLEKKNTQLEDQSSRHISKVGVLRYNPFDDTGGDQSFALALLDDRDDGIVVSSLHGRQGTRMYAKPVRAGNSTEYDFSNEELQAIKKAQEQESQ